ncbi:B-box zinc finger protein [Nitrolancea hollandica]|uniref:Uncharacterized protein n=1 Tax=Nitrolancea hollandica Lb TaxID=1129897 RepID=I4EGG9_9BACT|nr:B-box zinc finger protein [Nitrolancea hollandica]CCF83781.1 conserved membrane hypothetical protein [Nitrolancea hollandica Lb]
MVVTSEADEPQCTYHPNVRTRLRCSKCGTPICPRCAVETPVGFRCPECAAIRGLPTYRTSTGSLLKAVLIGLGVALATGALWGFFPAWKFYAALVLGFGVAEGIAWAADDKRGADLQAIGMGCVLLGLLVSRLVMAEHLGISFDYIRGHLTDPHLMAFLQLRLLPDLLFAALAVVIPFIRFR